MTFFHPPALALTEPMTASDTYRISLVDDDQMMLRVLETTIRDRFGSDKDLRISCFTDSDSFIEKMQQEQPHIVVLDYYLDTEDGKSQNGLELLKKIKSLSPDTFVIMLSAQKREEVVFQAMTSGAFDFVLKNERSIHSILTDIEQCLKNVEWIRTRRNVLWMDLQFV